MIMAASPQLDTAMQMFRSLTEKFETLADVEDFRAAYEEFTSQFQPEEGTTYERVGAGGVPADWAVAPGAADDPVMIWLHGGGYMIGSMRTHRPTLSRLSKASGGRVLGLDYRLAPENPFPAAVQDTVAAYRWLLANGTDPKKIVIGGDSAGGGLTVAALVALRYTGEPMPAAGISHSGWTDLKHTGESITTKAEIDPILSREMLDLMAQTYVGGRDPGTPLASPFYADLHGLPPLLVQAGTAEILLDDAIRFTDKAKAAGVDVTLEIWDDMPHIWQVFAPILPEGQQAIDHMGEFVRKHTS
jgi:acetyl esterase/lipase